MGDIRDNISENILIYRKRLNLTQEELANKINVKKTSVSSWERKANAPDIETLYKLCKLFNISLDDMYGVNKSESIESIPNIIEDKPKILDYYDSLNSTGKQEAEKRVKELTYISDYTVPEYIQPIAAHTDDTSEENIKAIEAEFEDFDDLP